MSGYQGPVRILGSDGILLTTGSASLDPDPELGGWAGLVQTLRGTAVAGKALVVELEVPGDGRGRAQLVPNGENGEYSISSVIGLGGGWPFMTGRPTDGEAGDQIDQGAETAEGSVDGLG